MKGTPVIVCVLLGALVTGCVAAGTHKQIRADLKQARNQLAAAQEQVEAEKQRTEEFAALKREKEKMSNELLEAQTALARTRSELDERERAAKEAEIARLTQTRSELMKSLESEIAKGDIQIQQVRDRLRITMVDHALFDSGRAQVKPDGLKVLKRVSDILKNVTDKQIRIEGHTDNVPIGPKIIERFPTNWELSTARAASVVRYLIEKGGVDRVTLSAAGYAYNKPVASNETLEGRAENRRIEIVLYPKDLSDIAKF
ncbi:MAG: flagellar motor protein MotB [Nitrospirota bacterium]|nr:flagellar motor protein MotB [Nitrospirota bacterium]